MSASPNRKPRASSSSWPGVRMVTESGSPSTRISSGSSTATASSRPSSRTTRACAPRWRTRGAVMPTGCQVASGPRWSNAAHARTPTGMRLVSFGPRGGELPAVLDGDEVVPLAQLLRLLGIAVPDMNAVLGLWEHIAPGDRRARRVARRRAAAAHRRPARPARPPAGERRRHRPQLRRGARGRARTGADPLREAGDVAPRAGGPHRAPRDDEHARLRGRARGGHRPRGPPHRGGRRPRRTSAATRSAAT